MSAANFPVRHLVAELRYAPTLAFYSAMDKIGIALGEHYPEWERSPLTLELRDREHRRRCYLSHHRSFYEAVDFHDETREFEHLIRFFDKLHYELQFVTVRRLGVRQFASVGCDDPFPEMVRKVARKFHLQSDRINRMLRGRIEDISFVADVRTENGWRSHLRLGPMERKQWFELIPYELGLFSSGESFAKFQETFSERMFFVDVDGYQEDFPYSDVATTLASIRRGSTDVIADLIQYLKE